MLDILRSELGISGKKAKALLDQRRIFVNEKRIWIAGHKLQRGDRITVQQKVDTPAPSTFTILYEDHDYIVINKPAGFVSNGTGSIEQQVQKKTAQSYIKAVHRLDKDTTGCLIMAKHAKAEKACIQLFKDLMLSKLYHAIVIGRLSNKRNIIAQPLDGMKAKTSFVILDSNNHATHLKIRIETGRTHQIRKHMMMIGHSVAGDKQYMPSKTHDKRFMSIPRQMLHAAQVTFRQPITQKRLVIKAPLPKDFSQTLKLLHLN